MTMFVSYDGDSTVTLMVGAKRTNERVIFASNEALVQWAEERLAVSGCAYLEVQSDLID